jgi:hypothetical protein
MLVVVKLVGRRVGQLLDLFSETANMFVVYAVLKARTHVAIQFLRSLVSCGICRVLLW